MQITHIYDIKKIGRLIYGWSRWEDRIIHQIGDTLTCENKKWKVVAVSYVRQGCFSVPQKRLHSLKVEPIDHTEGPQIGDVLL
jgi:hypothetical protein